METSIIRFGLIGAGAIGRLHAANLARGLPGARLAAVADVSLAAATACAAELQVPAVHRDHRELLKDPAVDAVAVSSPRQTHAGIVRDAAAAGKHVFCEKPLGITLPEIDEAIGTVEAAGVKLFMGFNRRFDSTYRRVHESARAGVVGAVRILHLVSRDPELPGFEDRTLEDIFLETAVHDFDMARFITGSEIAGVQAVAIAGGASDGVLTVLRFADGAAGTVDNSLRSAAGYDQRVELFGSAGTIVTENETPHRASVHGPAGEQLPGPLFFFRERYAPSYLAEMAEFVRCVREDALPAVTGADGRAATAAALAALRSLSLGRAVSPDEAGMTA